MSTNISNNLRYNQLLPEDVEFYERVNRRVTVSHALPFEVPVDAFFDIVVRGMKFFWEWYYDATQEQMLFIPKSEIIQFKGTSGNYDLKLPDGIQAVIDWKSASASFGGRGRVNDYLRIGLLQTYNMSSSTRQGSYGGTPLQMSSITTSMFEVETWRETYTKGIRATFNKNTQIFRLMTNVPDGLVLQCMTRVQPVSLYNDYLFEDYIVACTEEQLGKIVMAFNFKLPGDIEINYDEIKSGGRETKQQIEENIKESNVNDMIMSK